jgi:hypothetical protein
MYIKRGADTEANFVKIATIIDDNTLELEAIYPGSTGAGITTTFWPTVTGSGTIGVAASLLTIQSQGTNGNYSRVSRKADYAPLRGVWFGNINARLASQETLLGFVDTLPTPAEQAIFLLDGLVNTTVKCRTSFSAAASDIQETVVTLPNALTTLVNIEYAIELSAGCVTFLVNGIVVATHRLHLPRPYTAMQLAAGIRNILAAANTTVTLDYIGLQDINRIEVQNQFLGDATAVMVSEDAHYLAANLSSVAVAEQSVLAFTVPAGKTLYLLGWALTGDSATVTATYKVGKSAANPLTEPVSPNLGALDAVIYQSGVLPATIGAFRESTTGYAPVRFAGAGEVVRINIIPSAVTPTIFRAVLRFVLR